MNINAVNNVSFGKKIPPVFVKLPKTVRQLPHGAVNSINSKPVTNKSVNIVADKFIKTVTKFADTIFGN